jgi:hypothetical protein
VPGRGKGKRWLTYSEDSVEFEFTAEPANVGEPINRGYPPILLGHEHCRPQHHMADQNPSRAPKFMDICATRLPGSSRSIKRDLHRQPDFGEITQLRVEKDI